MNPLHIDTRRELFVDHLLIDRLDNTHLKLHEPVSGGVAIRIDKPWEGKGNFGISVIEFDGRLLVSYSIRRAPFGQRACLSRDDGKTWDYANEIVLRDDAPNGDLGYPASVQLDDDTLLTVYYQRDNATEKPCLMATHWRLPIGQRE